MAGFRPAGAALAVAAAFMGAGQALAQPSGAQVIQGQASFSQQGSSLVVTTQNGVGTNRSAINWQSFSVPAGSSTRFEQPSAASLSINRVVGNNPSAIYGTLSSNGRLVLVNPSGIAVGAGAVVDTAGFTASTLRMSDADALAGRLVFGGDGLGGGALSVEGRIVARSGDVVLIAPNLQVGSQALVQSPQGATLLAAGQKVELTGRGLEGIRLELQAPGDQAMNLGTLQGDAVGIFAGQLKHSGLIQATGVSADGGKVVLRAAGDALVEGHVTATAGTQGGAIDVFGKRVALFGEAALDASGAAAGGSVRVGGDYQGANAAVPNASSTFVGEGVAINANATQSGDGGRVIVWADDVTRFAGQISARGGVQGGNGGFAEVSGKQHLAFSGSADLRAPMGQAGTLLLDPNNLAIEATGSTTANTPAPSPAPSYYTFEGISGSSIVTKADLETQLGLGNVAVKTSADPSTDGLGGTITVNAPLTWSSNALALEAGTSIVLNQPIFSPTGRLGLLANGAGTITQSSNADLQVAQLLLGTVSGAVDLSAASNNQVATLAGSVASLDLKNATALEVGTVSHPLIGSISGILADGLVRLETATGNLTLNAGINSGSVALASASNIALNNDIIAAGGQVSLQAGANILQGAGAVISAAQVLAQAPGGTVELVGANQIGTLAGSSSAGSASGAFLVSNAAALTIGTVAGVSGITAGGDISITTSGASSGVTVNDSIHSDVGALTIDSSKNVSAGASGQVILSAGADIKLKANSGNVDLGGNHSEVFTVGGNVLIEAPVGDILGDASFGTVRTAVAGHSGAVNLSASGGISAGYIYTEGADGYLGGPSGYDGGDVTVSSGSGGVTILGVNASGGGAYSGSIGSGGNAGSVFISTTGAVNIASGIAAWGGGGFNGGAGGSGGQVSISSGSGSTAVGFIDTSAGAGEPAGNGGNVSVSTPGSLSLDGVHAAGGDGSGSAAGGMGGTVTIAAGTIANIPIVDTHGGSGGYGASGSGGNGGNGGDITITQTSGVLLLSPSLGSWGGSGGDGSIGAGTGGTGGNISIAATSAGLTLGSGTAIVAEGRSGGYDSSQSTWASAGADGEVRATASSAVTIAGDVYFGGTWINSGTMNVAGTSAGISGGGLFHNDGTVNMSGSSYLNPYKGLEIDTTGKLNLASGTVYLGSTQNSGTIGIGSGSHTFEALTNNNSGVISGKGTLAIGSGGSTLALSGGGTLYNWGTLKPGGTGIIGTLLIDGNLSSEYVSVLAVDIASASNYDRVQVSGYATFGSSAARSAGPSSAQTLSPPQVVVTYTGNASFAVGSQFDVVTASSVWGAESIMAPLNVPELTVSAPAPSATPTSLTLVATAAVKPPATPAPTAAPTPAPTAAPTPEPTAAPTPAPTAAPTPEPTAAPTPAPTATPAPPPPPPEPTPAPTPAPTAAPAPSSGPVVEQIVALLEGDHALAAQVITEMATSPLTTFTTLLLKEEQQQAEELKTGIPNVVDDNQCKR